MCIARARRFVMSEQPKSPSSSVSDTTVQCRSLSSTYKFMAFAHIMVAPAFNEKLARAGKVIKNT